MLKPIDLLKIIISFPSVSGKENRLADWLEAYFVKINLIPHRKGNNIWLFSRLWRDSKPTILLNSHIDTVSPVLSWTKNPFLPVEIGQKLYGLGSNDAGASIVALFQSFLLLTSSWQPNNFIFLASCEEEISGNGGIESVLKILPNIDLAIVGEPTEMQPAIAERGLMVIDAIVYGKSGHVAGTGGINAIYQTIPIINQLKNIQFPLKSNWLGEVQATVTMIKSGIQHNIIPDNCQFTIDVRSNEYYVNKQIFKKIKQVCKCELKARSFRLNSSKISLNHPLVKRAVKFGLTPFGSLTLSDQALINSTSLKIGPGKSSRSHTADEFIYLSEIKEAIKGYVRLLDQLILN